MIGGFRLLKRRIMNSASYSDVPIGIRFIQRFTTPSKNSYKVSVLVITYVAYMCYHLTRKPISVVKSVLHRNCSELSVPDGLQIRSVKDETWCDYPPFDGPNATTLLGTLDSAFLFAYAIAMFFSGFIAERISLRFFLAIGMLMSGIFCYLFGVAKTADIHSIWYFIFVQAMAGIFQTTGWPGVITVMSRWFGKSKRGLIFGIWNSHTSIGNILGSIIPASFVLTDWSLSFIVPGLIMGVCGFLLYLFLVDAPEIVGCQERETAVVRRQTNYSRVEDGGAGSDESEADVSDIYLGEQDKNLGRSVSGSVNAEVTSRAAAPSERTPMLGSGSSHGHSRNNHEAIGFTGALKIPGVIEFSLCLFFTKLVSYTFLFWLPMYISLSTKLDASESARLSTSFDYGGIIGAIASGVLSDYSGMPATTCTGMLLTAIPMLLVYNRWGAVNLVFNYFLLFTTGLLVNGPYALITTSVSAELGQHSSLEGNSKALATVTAIIDGTGSIGAAVGPLLAGWLSDYNWDNVFYMLIFSEVFAIFFLLRLVNKEVQRLRRNERFE